MGNLYFLQSLFYIKYIYAILFKIQILRNKLVASFILQKFLKRNDINFNDLILIRLSDYSKHKWMMIKIKSLLI